MLEKIQIILQYLLPKRWITYVIGLGASWKGKWITRCAISIFVKIYNINLKECQKSNIYDYETFNDFFARKLNINIRTIDNNPSTLIIPADGIISQIGRITTKSHTFQIKGSSYCLDELLAGHDNIINTFQNGNFSVIYIPPQNCHRVYMPCTGTLREALYIPGDLFSVHPKFIKTIPNILSRNERIICLFDTEFGYMAQILIGAMIVGSIETSWLGTVTPPRTGTVKHWRYNIYKEQLNKHKNSILLSKGEEMGLFKLGSTVVNLFDSNKVIFNNQLKQDYIVKIGMPFATGTSYHNHNNDKL